MIIEIDLTDEITDCLDNGSSLRDIISCNHDKKVIEYVAQEIRYNNLFIDLKEYSASELVEAVRDFLTDSDNAQAVLEQSCNDGIKGFLSAIKNNCTDVFNEWLAENDLEKPEEVENKYPYIGKYEGGQRTNYVRFTDNCKGGVVLVTGGSQTDDLYVGKHHSGWAEQHFTHVSNEEFTEIYAKHHGEQITEILKTAA